MLSSSQLDNIVRIISTNTTAEQIVLFGSYANGMATENSDLDIAIISGSSNPTSELTYKIRQILRSEKINYPMDIVVIPQSELHNNKDRKFTLSYEISHNGKIVYDRQSIS